MFSSYLRLFFIHLELELLTQLHMTKNKYIYAKKYVFKM